MNKIFISLSFIFCTFWTSLSAQKNELQESSLMKYQEAMDLFSKDKYASAIPLFEAFISTHNSSHELYESARFHGATSALRLFQKNADVQVTNFLFDFPNSVYYQAAYLELVDYYYIKHQWKKVLQYLPQADLSALSPEERSKYIFKLGYGYFMQAEYKKASNQFYELLNSPSEYQAPATYYYAHIAYDQKDYATALTYFRKIESNPKFTFLAPYYIAHVFYLQKKYSDLIEYTENKIDSLVPERKQEMIRMLGEAHYQLKNYPKAVEYLRQLSTSTREEQYHLAFALYKNKNYSEAVESFKQTLLDGDSLDQMVYYHLADCYIQLHQKKYAFQSFSDAYKLTFDKSIQEESLFALAKLSYETSLDPYQESVRHLTSFIKNYPKSDKIKDAYSYLLNIFLMTNNYKLAIDELEKMDLKSPAFQEAYQRVCYNYAIEFYQFKNYDQAVVYFQKAQMFQSNKNITALSSYWTAETYYQQHQYTQAISQYEAFIYKPGAVLLPEFAKAHYNLGYACIHEKDFTNALVWFRKYLEDDEILDSLTYTDALLKVADIYYTNKEFNTSLVYYQKSMSSPPYKTDYALYQSAILQGVLGRTSDKKTSLENLVSKYENSIHIPEAKLQLAKIYYDQQDINSSLRFIDQVIIGYPNTASFQKAFLEKAQIYFNTNQTELALDAYKKYVANFPNYQDAQIALQQIKKIYTETNRFNDYTSYVSSLQFVNLTQASMDSTAYETAYYQFVENRCDHAIRGFQEYIVETDKKVYPGIFSTQAHFYRAECYFSQNEYKRAIDDYEYVINQPYSIYSEKSLVKATRILYSDKRYADALKHYVTLEEVAQFSDNAWEAKLGQMRCHYKLGNFDASIHNSNKILANTQCKEEERLEALYISGKSAEEKEDFIMAIQQYGKLLEYKTSVYYSEVLYQYAYILFRQNKWTESEAKVNDLLNGDLINKHFMAKGLMLLSDIYVGKKDYLQAKHTLQAVIENHDEPAVVSIAQEKLQAVNALEEKEKPKPQTTSPKSLEIDLNGDEKEVSGEDL